MGIRVRLCSDWCLREADDSSDYPQTSVSCIVRTQYPYFAQRYAGITGFGPVVLYALKFLTQPLQKHQQEADQQHRTGSPDCGDSKVQGHDTSYTGSNAGSATGTYTCSFSCTYDNTFIFCSYGQCR